VVSLTVLFACLVAVTALHYHRNLLQSLRMRRENLLLDAEIRLAASVFENSLQGVIVTDNAERIVKINPAVTEITGYTAAEALGRNWSHWLADEHRTTYRETVVPALAGTGKWEGEAAYRRKSGELLPVWQTVTASLDTAGATLGRIVIFSDNSERKRAEDQIRRIAYQDALTGLSNRRVFEDRLGNAVERARRHGVRIGVVFVDLCRFRGINDSLGYHVGDELLRATARRLQQRLRREDTLARLEGDKFGVILEAIGNASDAETVAKGMIEALAAPLRLGDESLIPASSIGVAVSPQDGEDVAALMENADTALNQAAKQGENRYCFYSTNMSREASERLTMEWALRRAIERNELVLHYQPQYSMARRGVVGMEALVRWQHPERGLLGPGEFIALAEESGLIVPLSRWVLRRALSDWHALNEPGAAPLRLSVNVSAQQFPQPDFVASVAAALKESGVPPGELELEITESVLVGDSTAAAATLRELKDLGVRIALDDFGTGYSSLSYLANLPLDTVKIDRAFIRDLDTNASHQALVRAILQMCHALELEVVAEGVETEAEALALRRLGGNVFQGFLFSKALSSELFSYARARTLPLTAAN
jgi:diguanylate cyclase (GGDEF)-like protein/PAS domain S-box-containing protein